MSIAKETTQAIESFAKRRRDLIIMRGLCAFAASVILIMSGLALLDRFVIMPDQLRWVLSLLGYVAVGYILYRVCLRHLWGKENMRQTARMIEKARPDLREDLISAVELGDNTGDESDSAVFRNLLQSNVASRIKQTKSEDLLPASLVSRWVKLAGAAVLALILLCFSPHFLQLFSRALLPGANLARPSDIAIMLITPDPGDRIVPSGDDQLLEVKITGGDVDRVSLETIEEGAATEKNFLKRSSGNRFGGTIKVARKNVRYRVRAGGSVTRYYQLESRPRPQVGSYKKIYQPPSYSGLPAETLTHEHGDLSGLEGTTVTLELAVNQAIDTAELQLESDRKEIKPLTIALEKSATNTLSAQVPLTGDHTSYKVHLVAAESGFENKFSPFFEIRTVPDMVPTLQITQPENNREARFDSTIELAGTAQDDVSLASIHQAYRINNASWIETQLFVTQEQRTEIQQQWNLSRLPLRAGDVLVTKLIAIDSKGNRGESTPVRLAITGGADDSEERLWAEKQDALADELTDLKREVQQLAHAASKAEEVLKKDPEKRDVADRQDLVKAHNAADEAEAKAKQAMESLKEAIREAPDRSEAQELAAVAAKVADLKNQTLQRLDEVLEDAAEGREPELKEDHHRPAHLGWDAADAAQKAAEAMQDFAAEDMAKIAAKDLESLAEAQKDIAETSDDTPKDERDGLMERQDLNRHLTEEAEEDLRDLAEHLKDNERNIAKKAAEHLEEGREKLDEALAKEQPEEQLPAAADRMQNRLEHASREAERLAEATERRADQTREELAEKTNTPSREVEELRWEAEQLARNQEQLDNEKNADRAEKLAEELDTAREKFAEKTEAVADQLKDLADIEAASPAGNDQRAEDIDNAARALDAVAEATEETENTEQAKTVSESLADLQEAMRAAEAQANAEDIAAGLEELAQTEEAARDAAESGEASPDAEAARDQANDDAQTDLAENLQEAMRDLPKELKEGIEDSREAEQAAQQAANSPQARELKQEMEQRERSELRDDNPRDPRPQDENAASLQEQMAAIQEAIAPQTEAAREQLAQMAPEATELLRDLAEELNEAAEAADSLAEQAADSPAGEPTAPELGSEAAELADTSAKAEEKLADAMEALRDQASDQDIATEEGREAARDADDAIAQLEQQGDEASAASEALEKAATAADPAAQSESLAEAAEAKREMADSLNELADQMQAIAEGDQDAAEEARTALRESEEKSGVEDSLNESYDKAEQLSELLAQANDNPEAALAALEEELQENKAMQAALSDIAEEKAAAAAEKLAEASAKESALAEQMKNGEAAQPQGASEMAESQQAINESAKQAGEALESAARHEERLGDEAAAEALAEVGESAENFAAEQGEGSEALGEMQSAQPASPSAKEAVASAEKSLAESSQKAAEVVNKIPLMQSVPSWQKPDGNGESEPDLLNPGASPSATAANDAPSSPSGSPSAPPAASSPAQPSPLTDPEAFGMTPEEAQQGAALAEALDALDEMINGDPSQSGTASEEGSPTPSNTAQNPPSGQPSPGTPPTGQPSQTAPSSAAQAAQQALADAQAQQAAAMESAREQGMTPGQSAPSPAQGLAQNGPPGQPQSGQPQPGQPGSPTPGQQPGQPGNQPQGATDPMGATANAKETYALGDGVEASEEDWGKLPPKVAKDIIEARRQGVSPEYRSAIESYYKAIAEKARRK